MADLVFNVARGRVAEYYSRVQSGAPATSGLKVIVYSVVGGTAAHDEAIRAASSVAAVQALPDVAEVTNTGYSRMTLGAAQLTAPAPTSASLALQLPQVNWPAIAPGDAWEKLLVAYFADTAGADSTGIPLTAHDFHVVPAGRPVLAPFNPHFYEVR